MKIFSTLIIFVACLASPARAAWIVESPNMACTADVNEWGHSSNCSCPEATLYNQKIGFCLQGEAYPILVQGVLNSKTPRIELATKFGKFELIVKKSEIAKLKKANGLTFEVSGEFVLQNKRSRIIVEELNWLE